MPRTSYAVVAAIGLVPLPLSLCLALCGCGSKSGGGGGLVTGTAAFIGTWNPIGQEAGDSVASEMCGTSTEVEPITSSLVISQGPAGNTIVVPNASGCKLTFAVNLDTATAASGQMCTTTDADAGETSVETVSSYTLIASGSSLTTSLMGTLTNTKTGKTPTTCSISAEAEYVKE